MFSFFSKEREVSEYEYISTLLGERKFSLGFKDTYVISADDLLKCDLQPYWGQRAVDEIHINTIANGIKNSNGLFHPIILANIIPREEYSILDGQHRYQALSRISETQRKQILIQVDVINFETEDDKWIWTNYEWINIVKGIPKDQLDKEGRATQIVDECSKHFGKYGGGHYKIGDFTADKNKQNSRLMKSRLKSEILKKMDKLRESEINDVVKKIAGYNQRCCKDYHSLIKGVRIGSATLEECKKRDFWLGVNFPGWLDEIFP